MSTILETINSPADLKKLSMPELKQLANELRTFIIDNVSKTGGHLSSSLGTVELAIAIHYVFDTPEDRLVWDVGHQAYAHKILTRTSGTECRHCASTKACRDFRSVRKVPMTVSGQDTRQLPSLRF